MTSPQQETLEITESENEFVYACIAKGLVLAVYGAVGLYRAGRCLASIAVQSGETIIEKVSDMTGSDDSWDDGYHDPLISR